MVFKCRFHIYFFKCFFHLSFGTSVDLILNISPNTSSESPKTCPGQLVNEAVPKSYPLSASVIESDGLRSDWHQVGPTPPEENSYCKTADNFTPSVPSSV